MPWLLLLLALITPLRALAAEPAAGAATVIVYRHGHTHGAWNRVHLSIDGAKPHSLRNGRYLTLALDPGRHRLEVGEKSPAIEQEFAAGTTSYFLCSLEVSHGRWVLVPVAKDQAAAEVAALKPEK